MANDDNLDLEFNVNGDGERAIERIKGKLQDLGATAEYASQKQVDGANDALAKYKQEADVLDEIAQKEARMARAAAQTRVASNRILASNASTSATVANAGTTAGARADLAIQRVLTEEVRGTNLEREQENRNLLTAGKLLTEQERQQNLIQQRTIAAAREEQRQRALIASQEKQAAAEAIRAEQQRAKLVQSRIGMERRAAIQAERNQAALASPNLGSERKVALAAERGITSQDVEQSNALRYALYDTAQTATLVGTAITAIGTASVVAAAQGEQAFANLSAKFDDSEGDLSGLNASLLELTENAPINLADAVGVAELGAQMNIAKNDLDEFTTVVTQFSATTNVTSDAAAESFGRISQLLDVPPDQFKNLSSAIFQVGVDSVATESQILKTAEEISGSASAYGFTADKVVGLSAAFASLAIQPEQARGATTRIFNNIAQAVQSGGPALENYARIMGVTKDEAVELWNTDPSAYFERLVHGLGQSENRLKDLRSIGATGVFDNNVLNRLSENADFLTKSLGTAKQAYDDGDATAKAYAKTTETVIAQLKELGNSLVALGIRAGGPLLEILKPIISTIKVIVQTFADMPPIVLSSLAALTLLVGGYILFKGATATAIAAVIGLRYVLSQLAASAGGAGLSITTLRTQLGLLTREMTLGSAASTKLTGTIAAAGLGARVAATGFSAMGLAMRLIPWVLAVTLASQVAQGLYEMNKGAIAAANGFGVVSTSAKDANISSKEIVESFKNARAQLVGINDFGNTNAVASLFGDIFNVTDYTKQAKNEIAAIDERLAKLVSDGNGQAAADLVGLLGLKASEIADVLPTYSQAIDDAATSTLKLGDDSLTAATQIDAYKQALEDAQAAVDGTFSSLNQGSDFAAAIQELFSGIYDAGNAFGYLDETGRTNLSNLQDAMAQTIAYGQSLGMDTTDSIALLFLQLQQSGVDTAGLINLIASQPYIFSADLDISAVQAKLAALGAGGGSFQTAIGGMGNIATKFNGTLNKLAVSAPRAATGVSSVGKAAKKAKAEVRTLNDYASDLKTVFSDATQYRFGVQDALDDISSKWTEIRDEIKKNNEDLAKHKESIADARRELASYRADLAGLQAQLSTQKYFLSIAIQYGDTLRGQEISANIADLNSQIADKQKDVNQAQKDSVAPFDGATKSIVEQRQSLSDLYGAYQDAIIEYARSGATQDQLRAKVDQLRAEFVRQATQAGYSRAEIGRYSNAFRDMTVAINGVPRNITVKANTNPAIQALNDFVAKAKNAKADPNVGSGSGPKARSNGIQAGNEFVSGFADVLRRQAIKQAIDAATSVFGDAARKNAAKGFQGGGKFARGGFVPGENAFPIGGFVPGNAPADRRYDNALGIVGGTNVVSLQGGEPIITNAARSKYGDQMFEAINALRFQPSVIRPNITVASSGGDYTELSPTDRGLLAEIAARIGVTLSSTALEKANGASAAASSRRMAG